MKFNFPEPTLFSTTINLPLKKQQYLDLEQIAATKTISIQDVIRTFIDASLAEYFGQPEKLEVVSLPPQEKIIPQPVKRRLSIIGDIVLPKIPPNQAYCQFSNCLFKGQLFERAAMFKNGKLLFCTEECSDDWGNMQMETQNG